MLSDRYYLSLSHMQPDIDEDDDWNDDERENSVPLDALRPSAPIFDRTRTKSHNLRRRQTIGAMQGQQYASQRAHRTPLQHIQAMFRPRRSTQTVVTTAHASEGQPMIANDSAARENHPSVAKESTNERRSDAIASV